MAITITSRDTSGQIVTVPGPGDEPPSLLRSSDAAPGGETGSPAAPPTPPAGAAEPSGESAPPSPAPAEREAAGDTGDDEDLSDVPDEQATVPYVNKRIKQLNAKRRATERALAAEQAARAQERAELVGRLDTLTRVLAGSAPPVPETPAQPSGPPQAEQFASHDDYMLAAARYGAQQELAQRDQQTALQRQAQQQAAMAQQLVEREQAFQAAHPDFAQVVRAGLAGKVSPVLQQALMLVPDGPAVAYALAAQPDLVERLNTLPPPLVLVELGRLSPAPPAANGLPAGPAAAGPTTPQAPLPAPPTPLSGAGPGAPTVNPAELPQAEFRKKWSEGWRPTPRDFGR